MVLAAIELVNPLWAWGLLAAGALPLLAHLFSAHGGRLAAFPAVRFVERAAADAAQLLRTRHRLLMLLRIAILTALVLALTRPLWRSDAVAAVPGAGVAVVVVLDRSASMMRTQAGATLFDDARRRAASLLASLDPARDVATVVLLDDAPQTLSPGGMSANFAWLIDRLDAVEPAPVYGDTAAAVNLARAELRRLDAGDDAPTRTARIDVFSDMQATQWRGVERAETARLVFHTIGAAQDNLAVFNPGTAATRVIAGQPAQAHVHVGNFTDQVRTVTVAMSRRGEAMRRDVRVEPFAVAMVTFDFVPEQPGVELLQFAIEHGGDALALDDRTGRYVAVESARPVDLVTAADPDDPTTAAYFVARAMRARDAGVRLTVRPPAGDLRSDADVILLIEAGAVSRDRVEAWVDAGRTVIWAIDSPEAAAALDHTGGRWVEADAQPVAWVQADAPVLRVFEGPAMQPLMAATFARRMAGSLQHGVPLMRLADGLPLLSVVQRGDGRLIVFAADLAPRSSDFVKGPAFAPLLHQLVRSYAPRGTPPNPTPRSIGDDRFATLGPVAELAQWVELDAAESDLRTVAPREMPEVDATAATGTAVRGRAVDLWPALAALAALLLTTEALLVRRWGGSGHG
jgi:hypothetical protein